MGNVVRLTRIFLEKLHREGLSREFWEDLRQAVSWRTFRFFNRRLNTPSGQRKLRECQVFWKDPSVSPDDPVLYLSFDLGVPKIDLVEQALDVLREHGVHATFFLTDQFLREVSPAILNRISAEGHTVGNHTVTHPNFTRCTAWRIRRELDGCAARYQALAGREMPKIVRPPYGSISLRAARILHRYGYRTFSWSIHIRDFDAARLPDPEHLHRELLRQTGNGGILLMHLLFPEVVDQLGSMIELWRAQGYRFETLDRIDE